MTRGVLVVEDDGLTIEAIRQTLAGLGYPLSGIVRSGEGAVRHAREHQADLVLIDVHLGGALDGVDAARAIRAEVSVPIVFLAAHSDSHLLLRATEAEACGFLVKPFEDNELRCAIEVAMSKHRVESQLRDREQLLATTLSSIGEAVITTDAADIITFLNPSAERLTGWRTEDAIGKPLQTVVRLMNEETGRAVTPSVHHLIATGQVTALADRTVLERSDGARCAITSSTTAIKDACGKVLGSVMLVRDASNTRRAEAERTRLIEMLRTMTVVDELTGLQNRRGFRILAEQELKRAHRLGQRRQLFFADLDCLKHINDTLGHDAGDRAIRDAAMLLRAAFRTADIVARVGGDEFVVICTDGSRDHEPAIARLEALIQDYNATSRPPFTLAISIGSATYDPHKPQTIDVLLKRADRAMYVQKAQHKIGQRPQRRFARRQSALTAASASH